jgi:hypothetical protein
MSRYVELVGELKKLSEEAKEEAQWIDPSHALQRVAALEHIVLGLVWLSAQTLKELAKRDGIDVT